MKVRFGNNTNLVEEVIEFVESGEFFCKPYKGSLENIIVENDFEKAKEFAWTQNLPNCPLAWADIREQEMSEVMGVRYSLSDFDEADAALGELVDQFGDVLSKRIKGDYEELLDEIMGDMYNAAYCRAVKGVSDNLLEQLFMIYKNGGWPCGWEGDYPDGKLIVYIPA